MANVPIPADALAAMRALHVRSVHYTAAAKLLVEQAQEFDLDVLRFYRAHGLTPEQVKSVDLDGGVVVLNEEKEEVDAER